MTKSDIAKEKGGKRVETWENAAKSFEAAKEETLQSIANTLKRIEIILLLEAKIRYAASDAQEIVEQLLKES